VLGSTLPVRFPESLRLADRALTPFAIQPGQVLQPESCAVGLRIDGPFGSWVGVWRPADRRLHQLAAPDGWLAGSGLWTADGVLRLPYATAAEPCGVARMAVPAAGRKQRGSGSSEAAAEVAPDTLEPEAPEPVAPRPVPLQQAPLARLVTK
jgi:hypothetical protein